MQTDKYTTKNREFWQIIISLLLASLFIFANLYSIQPLLPVFVEEFQISVSVSSLAMSLTIIGLIFGLIFLGFFSDRNGRRYYIIYSILGAAIPFFILPLIDSFTVFLILRFIQGFALAGVPAAALAYISEEIDRKNVSYATALYISSNALGGMLGRVLSGFLTDTFSWQTAFYFFAVIGLVLFAGVWKLLPRSRHFTASNVTFAADIKGFLIHLKNPVLLVVFGLGIVLQISFTGVWTYLPFYLQEPPFDMSLQAISYLFFAYGIGVIGSPVAGKAAERFGLRKVRMCGVLLLSFGIFMALSPHLWVIVVGLCFTCLGFFAAHSLTAASVGLEATHHKGSASSLYLVSYYIGVALGSSVLSPLWISAGWSGLILFTALLPIAYVLIITLFKKKTGSATEG